MKYFIKRMAILFGINITPATPYEKIRKLLNNVRPFKTDHNLIRFGPKGNGGYLLPDDLEGIEAVFSPGVGSISDFENDCAAKGMKIFMADKSVEGPSYFGENFNFTKKYIGSFLTTDFITLDAWIQNSLTNTTSDLLLQMDIEGFEYEVIQNMSTHLLNRFRIIIIEFHNLDDLLNQTCFFQLSRVFDKILSSHTCVHIHPNNCCRPVKLKDIEIPPVMEFTFLRSDRIQSKSYSTIFPHALDHDCTANQALHLPKCWYTI